MFREVPVFEVREVLRLWLAGQGLRAIERLSRVDRKTVRRYVMAAEEPGLVRDRGDGQLTDEFLGSVVEAVRPTAATAVGSRGGCWLLITSRSRRGSMRG
jgi:hypothetical protein